jgi:hypothetical protein
MKGRALNLCVAASAFGVGVLCAWPLVGPESRSGEYGDLFTPALLLGAGALCFTQAYAAERGLRKSVLYNSLMLSLSGLLFLAGGFALALAAAAVSFR